MFGSTKLWPALTQSRAEGRDWYYGDHGYFGRGRYFRCTKNAFQHTGHGKPKSDRFSRFSPAVQPWRRGGRHVLVCPPDDCFARLMGTTRDEWLGAVMDALSGATDRPIMLRERGWWSGPLPQALTDCWAMVTFMSNAAVESILAGVPVFCTGDCAARTMGMSDLSLIETPVYPDGREEWAMVLADNQWTLREMSEGALWKAIG